MYPDHSLSLILLLYARRVLRFRSLPCMAAILCTAQNALVKPSAY